MLWKCALAESKHSYTQTQRSKEKKRTMLKLVNASFHAASMCFSFFVCVNFLLKLNQKKAKILLFFRSFLLHFVRFASVISFGYMFAHKTTRVGERNNKKKEARRGNKIWTKCQYAYLLLSLSAWKEENEKCPLVVGCVHERSYT